MTLENNKKNHVRYSTAVRKCKVNIVYLSNVYKCIDRRGCFDAEVDKILFLKRSLKAERGTCVHMCPLSALSQVPGTELMSVWWRARCISFILGLVRRLRGVMVDPLSLPGAEWPPLFRWKLRRDLLPTLRMQTPMQRNPGKEELPQGCRPPGVHTEMEKLDVCFKIYIDLKWLQLQPSFTHWNVFKLKKKTKKF